MSWEELSVAGMREWFPLLCPGISAAEEVGGGGVWETFLEDR